MKNDCHGWECENMYKKGEMYNNWKTWYRFVSVRWLEDTIWDAVKSNVIEQVEGMKMICTLLVWNTLEVSTGHRRVTKMSHYVILGYGIVMVNHRYHAGVTMYNAESRQVRECHIRSHLVTITCSLSRRVMRGCKAALVTGGLTVTQRYWTSLLVIACFRVSLGHSQ